MRSWIMIIGICALAACRSTKKIQTAIAKKDTSNIVMLPPADARRNDSTKFIQNILNAIARNHINFKTFSAKINVDYRDADNITYNVNAFVRMYKDSALWVSINAIFGIEAMRALITKDSVKVLDKQNKTYTARSIDYLQDVADLPLNLSNLQDLIVGNPVFLDSNIVSYQKVGNLVRLLSVGKSFKNLITVNADNKTLQHSKVDDAEYMHSRTADLTYTDYDTKQGVMFSTKRNVTVVEKNKLDITLDFKQYDINPNVSFPFTIPKNYKRR